MSSTTCSTSTTYIRETSHVARLSNGPAADVLLSQTDNAPYRELNVSQRAATVTKQQPQQQRPPLFLRCKCAASLTYRPSRGDAGGGTQTPARRQCPPPVPESCRQRRPSPDRPGRTVGDASAPDKTAPDHGGGPRSDSVRRHWRRQVCDGGAAVWSGGL